MEVFNVKYDVFAKKDSNSKFVVIGDLHGWVDNSQINKIVKSIREQKPDVILIAGDLLAESYQWLKKGKLDAVKKFLRALTETGADVVVVLGNHDTHKVSDELLRNYLDLGNIPGVHPLYNNSVDLSRNNEQIHIAGLTTASRDGVTAVTNTIVRAKGIDERPKRIVETLGPLLDIDERKINILLAHDPRQLRMPEVDEATRKFDVRLAAHIHNGYLPFRISTKKEGVLDQDWMHYLALGLPKLEKRNFARGTAYGNSRFYVLCTQTNAYYLVSYNEKKKDNEYRKITKEEAIEIINKFNLTPNVITGGVNRYVGVPFEGSEITTFQLKKRQ